MSRYHIIACLAIGLVAFLLFVPAAAQQVEDFLEPEANPAVETETVPASLNLFDLVMRGGLLMVPIGIMSVIVVTLVIERFISLRRSKVIPNALIEGLSELSSVPGAMDPRQAFRLCQENKSAAGNVIQSMLLKIGRPQSEVENAVSEASQREASRLYANVRWLNLSAAVAPLMGLLGTVWGMIQAFFRTTQLQAGQNKADFLAEGIYVALVTTFAGLIVAIPAAIFAHYFEGRIQSLFHYIEELVFNLTPQIERFEGRMRVSPQSLSGLGNGETRTPSPDLGVAKTERQNVPN